MVVLTESRLKSARYAFERRIHNNLLSVRLGMTKTMEAVMPGYEDQVNISSAEFVNFKCSFYDMLSGKLNRIFRNRFEEIDLAAGTWDNISFVLQYVSGLYILLVRDANCTNVVDSNTECDDLVIDFTALDIRADLDYGAKGAQVHNITDGSKANILTIAVNKLTTDGLTGGTDNLFQVGDNYQIMNLNDLQVHDQVEIDDNWREVQAVIHDSEEIQHSVLMSD